jgi:nicotinamide-nucleotide amidase
MPGVPEEVRSMVTGHIVPILNGVMTEHRSSRTLLTTGIPESELEARISSVDFSQVAVAYLPSPTGVRLRISSFASSRDAAEEHVDQVCGQVVRHIGEYVFGEGTETLESVVGQLLADRNATLSTAESCSGGLMADKITNVPGCSGYFLAGMVAYSNKSKTDVLSVDTSLIERHGAVSAEVAVAMARGARARFASTYAVSTTGIAGPDGGTADKPVGLVWIGLASPEGVRAFRCHFGEVRWRTKLRAAQTGLDLLRRHVLGMPLTNTFITLTGDLQT